MSCIVMAREPLAALANAVETRLNIGYDYWGFEAPSSLYHELADCKTSCTYFAEPIYRKLYAVNIRAYNGRYSSHEKPADEQAPDVDINRYTITRRPEYREHGFAVCRWHYQLAMLLDFWLYQTLEDATYADPLRLAMAAFRDSLYSFIVTNSPGYYNGRWGELPRQTPQTVEKVQGKKASELIAELQKAVAEHGDLNILVRHCSDGYDWSGLCVHPDPPSPMEALDGIAGTIDINVF